ncbi:histone deacetylase [Shewanella sp. C32]|uniref:Histone deacetylase n=1 Tax=Shewanella electrica TaxID=515560 RepID=A0ABT2FGT3_9GAMM|nr:histone deacetylase [Shewanella electrica]MCH1923433.1 histone deacetylase [Shewanella electrica]MCS4555530.1 histone deacetylase [Shewanella electrica]
MLSVTYHASYSELALPPQHRFPIAKYRLLYQRLQQSDFKQHCQFLTPTPAPTYWLTAIHETNYVNGLLDGSLADKALRRIGFPWSEALITRTLNSIGATYLAAQTALQRGFAAQISGGYHHAHYDFGSGFCLFNDLVIAADQLIQQGLVRRVLIFDCDVHQGDGTATLTQQRGDIISVSLHCDKNFPARKALSHHDLAFDRNTDDQAYIQLIQQVLPLLVNTYQPDIVFYDAGVDVHQGDELGLIQLTDAGLLAREKTVLSMVKKADIPIICVAGGGYCRDTLHLVDRHLQLYVAAKELFS